MSPASKTPGLLRRLLTRPAPVEQDAADFGTCIGLEFSLDQQAPDTVPAVATPMPSPSWVQRLTARGKAAP